jgi:hypothetical protein
MLQTINNYAYKAFGLNIISEIEFPELLKSNIDDLNMDILFKIVDLTSLWNEIGVKKKFIVNDKNVLFEIENIAIICVQGGKRVLVSPLKEFSEDRIRLYLLGTCMSIILMQRKVLPLHGSAIAIDGKAYAFVGNSGAGKSTLASIFLDKGYQLLSDDVIAVSLFTEKSTPYVTPSYPQQKLWQDSLNFLGMESSKFTPLFDRETKYSIPVKEQFQNKPLPLAGIFELQKYNEETIIIKQVSNLERFHKLYLHTFRNFLIPRLGLMDWHFENLSKFINKIDFYQIQRPSTKYSADELALIILERIKEGNVRQ